MSGLETLADARDTLDYGLQSMPWHVDWAKEIRMTVGDTSVQAVKT